MTEKKFKDLNLSNAYLFAAALSDEITCQLILEVLLGQSLPKIVTIQDGHLLA